jgi:hypothetical protein
MKTNFSRRILFIFLLGSFGILFSQKTEIPKCIQDSIIIKNKNGEMRFSSASKAIVDEKFYYILKLNERMFPDKITSIDFLNDKCQTEFSSSYGGFAGKRGIRFKTDKILWEMKTNPEKVKIKPQQKKKKRTK